MKAKATVWDIPLTEANDMVSAFQLYEILYRAIKKKESRTSGR
jgi:hypothetical protein